MATLVTSRSLFLHLPKTGGTWAASAMLAAGVPVLAPPALPFHADLEQSADYADRFTFAFVRHPLEFWRSYWAFRIANGWAQESSIDAQVGCGDFDTFARRVAECFPGAAGALYERFIGPPTAEIDFVGRYERLADDLVGALRAAGESFDEDALRAHAPLNISDYGSPPVLYRPETAALLAANESAMIDRFYGFDPVPQGLLEQPRRLRRVHVAMRARQARPSSLARPSAPAAADWVRDSAQA